MWDYFTAKYLESLDGEQVFLPHGPLLLNPEKGLTHVNQLANEDRR